LGDNFRSVQATEEMDRALALLALDSKDEAARGRFSRALSDELANITEAGERESAQALKRGFEGFLAEPSADRLRALQLSVRAIYQVNEHAMLAKDRSARR